MIAREERKQLAYLLIEAQQQGIEQTRKLEFVESDTRMDAIAAMYLVATERVPYTFNDLPDDLLLSTFLDMVGVDLKQEYPGGRTMYQWLLKIQDIHHWSFEQIIEDLLREDV